MKDRLVAGALAGIVGAVIQNIFAFVIKTMGFSNHDFADFGRIMIMFKPYSGLLAAVMGQVAHITVGMLFGILFAYVMMKTSSNYYLVKGFFYGLSLWFLLLGFGTMWRLPMWTSLPPSASLSILLGSLVYSLVTAYTLKLLDQRSNLI